MCDQRRTNDRGADLEVPRGGSPHKRWHEERCERSRSTPTAHTEPVHSPPASRLGHPATQARVPQNLGPQCTNFSPPPYVGIKGRAQPGIPNAQVAFAGTEGNLIRGRYPHPRAPPLRLRTPAPQKCGRPGTTSVVASPVSLGGVASREGAERRVRSVLPPGPGAASDDVLPASPAHCSNEPIAARLRRVGGAPAARSSGPAGRRGL